MNCPQCGCVLPQGAQTCPACGAYVAAPPDYAGYAQQGGYGAAFDPSAYGMNPYGQGYQQPGYGGFPPQGYDAGAYGQPNYGQGFDPTAYGANPYGQGYTGYPQGYQTAYGRFGPAGGDRGAFLGALSNLPRVLAGLLRDPGETLQGMMERADFYTGGVAVALSLLLTLLSAMVMTRGVVSSAMGGLSGLLGVSLAGDAASMSQGVSYIAGKIAASIGGIAALCQLFSIALPAAVAMVYLCTVRKLRFSFLLLSNFVAVNTLPSVAAALLCMVFSLLSPYLGAVILILGNVVSYVFTCLMIARLTGQPEAQSAAVKAAVVCISELTKILFIQLVGGALMAAALRTVAALIGTMGSLL